MRNPKISVLMPVYNTNPVYLRQAIESVLNQSFRDFEFLILNDSPGNKALAEIVESFNDPRIIYLENEKTLGISDSRNKLMELSRGEYLAIHDHDDISRPTRLERQAAYLDANPNVGVVSCNIFWFPASHQTDHPSENMKIKKALLHGCVVAHPAAMLRKSVLAEHGVSYRARFSPSEDYQLWCEMLDKTMFHNIPDALMEYRWHGENTSITQQQKMNDATEEIQMLSANRFPALYKKPRRPFKLPRFIFRDYVNRKGVRKIKVLGIPAFSRAVRAKKIKLAMFKEIPNFGDLLNRALPQIFGYDTEVVNDLRRVDALFVGSMLEGLFASKECPRGMEWLTKPALKIWGAGFIKPEDGMRDTRLLRKLDIRAVRGKITLERLRGITGRNLDNVALGDPGLLCSLFADYSKIRKKFKLGVIPHFVDADSPLLDKIKARGATVIDIRQNPADFLEQLAACEAVLSSAMHGLIAADALGIPNMRMVLSDKIVGGDYKFNDYYSAFGLDSHEKLDLREIGEFADADVQRIAQNYKITPEMVRKIQKDLIASFPFPQMFPLPLDKIQNIRLYQAAAEQNPNLFVPEKWAPVVRHLRRQFPEMPENLARGTIPSAAGTWVSHDAPATSYMRQKMPLVFPKSVAGRCAGGYDESARAIFASFAGLRTDARRDAIEKWTRDVYKDSSENVKIEFTDRGRDFPRKAWDQEYYDVMKNSRFVLCPDGDFVWTYRFFEAVMCGAIPIIQNNCDLYDGFFFYDMETPLEKLAYRPDKARENLELFLDRYTLK
jgi:glycosyltransferase involved in cell wall biosynthesis